MSMSTSLSDSEVVDVTRSGGTSEEHEAWADQQPHGRMRLALVNDYELILRGLEALLEPLTERESEVVTFLASGMSNRDIADAMILSENTVKTHLKSIFQKIGVSSRAQAVARIVTDPAFQRVSGPSANLR